MSDDESDIEELIRKNVEEKNAFLASLLKDTHFEATVKSLNAIAKPTKRETNKTKPVKRKRERSEEKQVTELRCSARLQDIYKTQSLKKPPEAPTYVKGIRHSARLQNKSPKFKEDPVLNADDKKFSHVDTNRIDHPKVLVCDTQNKIEAAPRFAIKNVNEFMKSVAKSRNLEGESILSFKFNKLRCRILTKQENYMEENNGVLYWMSRDCRVQDNWALLFAQRLALKLSVPLYICFCIGDSKELYPSQRQAKFLIEGLKCVKEDAEDLNIGFFLINKSPTESLIEIIKNNNISCLVTDFTPLKPVRKWKDFLKNNLPPDVPLVEVDAHNVVPAWIASDHQETQQRSLKLKIEKQLDFFLTDFPSVCEHPYHGDLNIRDEWLVTDFDKFIDDYTPKLNEITWASGGPEAAFETLRVFLMERLQFYGQTHNDPTKNIISNISPWLHFGQISAQRIVLEVENFQSIFPKSCEFFLEQFLIRRELSDNFCLYNENYDNFNGGPNWGKTSLSEHRNDPRPFIYKLRQFENAETHDIIWNASQIQLRDEGKMHRYMRMYWCKKILEWTESPEKAIEIALYLNDLYSLDGSDPNGYVGVLWSICGLFDAGFMEREIFGKTRYMVDHCMVKKFDVKNYCRKFGLTFDANQIRKS